MKTRFAYTAAAAIMLMAAAFTAPAAAGDRNAAKIGPSTTVSVADLDLSRVSDARTLHERMQEAAHDVCKGLRDPRVLRTARFYKDCMAKAVADAVARVDHTNLTDIHEGRARGLASR